MEDRYEYSECFRYLVTIVDTATDEVVRVIHTKTISGVKVNMFRALRALGHSDYRAKDNPYAIYVKDSIFDEDEGMDRLEEIDINWPIDWNDVVERGIDFDVWYEDFLTDEERHVFDTTRAK